MNVLHWYANMLHGGGVASAVAGIAAAQARLGAHVTIAAAESRDGPLYEPIPADAGVEVLTWRSHVDVRAGTQQLRLMALGERARLRGLRPDVVHVHGEFNVDNLWAPAVFGRPTIVSPHGAFHPVVLAKSRRLAKQAYLAAERRIGRDRIVLFHALSPMERDHTTAIHPTAEVYCVPQGPAPTFRAVADTRPAGAPRSTRTTTYAFVGRLDVFTKGLDILLDAFAMAQGAVGDTDLRLVLVGPDWKHGRAWLEQRVRQLGIADRVRFAGSLTASGVAAELSAADCYVQLSRHEGFPLSVVEALTAGKPAILSDAIGTVSYDEVARLPHVMIVPTDAVTAAHALANMADRCSELRNAAEQCHDAVIEFFSWDRAALLHLEAYARVQ